MERAIRATKAFLLVLLLAGSGCVVIRPVAEWRQERRNRQAQALLWEATTGSDGKPFFPNEAQASVAQLDDRIFKLSRARELDPALTETHYWLGQYGLDRLEMPGASNAAVSAEVCMAELKTYIQQTPNDGKSYDYGTMFGMGIRTPGVLREKAWRALITGYFRFRCLRIWAPPNGPPRVELVPADSEPAIGQYRQRCDELVRLVSAYLREPPKKKMGTTHVVMLPFVYISQALRDEPQRIIDWRRLMEDVYGPDYASYSVLNPASTAANYLDSMGHTNLAREVRSGSVKKQDVADAPRPSSAPFKPQGYWEELSSEQGQTAASECPVIPSSCLEDASALPADCPGPLQILTVTERDRFLVTGSPLSSDQQMLRTFGRALFRQDLDAGKTEPLVPPGTGDAIAVTAVVPIGTNVWLVGVGGVVRYAPGSREWHAVKGLGKLPSRTLADGLYAGGRLWIAGYGEGGSLFVFSLDPVSETAQFHGVLRNAWELRGLSWVDGRLLVRAVTTWELNPDTGEWRRLSVLARTPVVSCGGTWWVGTPTGLETTGNPTWGELKPVGRCAREVEPNDFRRVLPPPRVPADSPLPDAISDLASDGRRLWMLSGGRLLAYEPADERWYGPFVLSARQIYHKLACVGGTIWAFGGTGRGPQGVLISASRFLDEGRKVGLYETATACRNRLAENARRGSPAGQGLWALGQGNANAALRDFDRAIRESPTNANAYFLKAYVLEKRVSSAAQRVGPSL